MNNKEYELLREAHIRYWNGEASPLSDEEYDNLMRKFKTENPNDDLVTSLGNTPQNNKIKHKQPMLSLDKSYSFKELYSWMKKVSRSASEKFVIQYKFDGLAGKYENGVFCTRGDGEYGENITRHVKRIYAVINNEKIRLSEVNKTVLGEIVIGLQDFEEVRNIDGKAYKHPRNFVAGMINRKEQFPNKIKLDFVEYSSSKSFEVCFSELNEERFLNIFNRMQKEAVYQTDGLVIKLKDEEYAKSLGYTAHHPNGAMAFKVSGIRKETKIIDIEWSAGREFLTPVAIVEPVEISGVTIQRVTLHNYDTVKQNDVCIGDYVTIERAGEVIPYAVSFKAGEKRQQKEITKCPFCGGDLQYSIEVACLNPKCPEKRFLKLLYSVTVLEIDCLGKTLCRELFNKGYTRLLSLLNIDKQTLLSCGRIGEKTAKKVFDNIQKAKNISADKFLTCLALPNIGKSTWKQVLKRYTVDEIIEGKLDANELAKIDGIGVKTAEVIVEQLNLSQNYFSRLKQWFNLAEVLTSDICVCFTGKMPEKRSYYEDLAMKNGWQVTDSVNKNLTYLVCEDINGNSSKLVNARKNNVQIIDVKTFLEKC